MIGHQNDHIAIIVHRRDRGGSDCPIESYLDLTLLSIQGK